MRRAVHVCRLLLGSTELESTARHPGIEANDALAMSEQNDIWDEVAAVVGYRILFVSCGSVLDVQIAGAG